MKPGIYIVLYFLMINPENKLIAGEPDIIKGKAFLDSCLIYAFSHQPLIEQLSINDNIIRHSINAELSDWFPQINFESNYQHYIEQPVSLFPDLSNPDGPRREIKSGVINSSALQFSASQIIFDRDVIYAARSARFYKKQSQQSNYERKIDLVLKVSKAFYDVLVAEAKLNFFMEDRARISKTVNDALSLYETGNNDKIDYQRAKITLNNIESEIYATQEQIKAKYALLKELMGYPVGLPLVIDADSNKLWAEAWLDTTQNMDYFKRIEYQLLQTNLKIQKASLAYSRLGFLPSLSAFGNYNLIFQNDDFSQLYNKEYPSSLAGIRFILPLFEGSRRIQEIKIARLKLEQMSLDTINLKSSIQTEFESAMASYKSNLKARSAAVRNVDLADSIYNTVYIQYNEGVKSFLEVIVAEADLRSSRINELNALYLLLASKLDVEAALGKINVNY